MLSGDMEKRQQMKDDLQRCIDAHKDELHSLSRDIWSNPEVAGNEKHAHDRLVRFFSQDQTWTVQSHYKLPTAFRASWGPVGGGVGDPVLNVGFLCEYDALPGIGHACGHNLIAEVGAAAAVGLKAALENQTELPVPVKVTVTGFNGLKQVTPWKPSATYCEAEKNPKHFFKSPALFAVTQQVQQM